MHLLSEREPILDERDWESALQETERGDRFGGLAHGNPIAARRRYQAVRTTSDAHKALRSSRAG